MPDQPDHTRATDPLDRLRATDPLLASANQQPPALEQFIATWPDTELDVAHGVGATAGSASKSAARRWRAGLLSGLLAIGVGGVTASAALTAVTGDPLGRRSDIGVTPISSSVAIAKVTAVDPAGGLPWTVRAGRSADGLWCLGVGQVDAQQRFGITGLDGVFREQPVSSDDDCAVLQEDAAPIIAQARTFVGGRGVPAVSVVYGITASEFPLRVTYPDGASAVLPVDERGLFAIARIGTLRETSPALHITGRDVNGEYTRPLQFGQTWSRDAFPRRVKLDPTKPVDQRYVR